LLTSPPRKKPVSERLCDAAVLFFAVWTISCHVVVAAGGNLHHLLVVFATAVVGLLLWRRRAGTAPPESWEAPPPRPPAPTGRAFLLGGFVAALAGTWIYARSGNVVTLWWWLVTLLGAAAAVVFSREEPRLLRPSGGRREERTLLVLGLGAAMFALVCHRPDIDDSFYVNVAVTAADHPRQALLAFDTLHGIPELPLHQPIYRIHSFELWNGALSYLTGIPAIYCFHWVTACVAAFLLPCALAVLFRMLLPAEWLWGVAAALLVLVAAGDMHRWYGNFSLVRIWQGKSVFLFVALPLVYAYAMRFALAPSWRRGWALAAVQVAAIGCTSSALWAAPASAGIALVTALRPSWQGVRTLASGLLSSTYVLGIGAAAKLSMSYSSPTGKRSSWGGEQYLEEAVEKVLGEHALAVFALGTLLAAWTLCRGALARRFTVAAPLLVGLFLLNPYTAEWIRGHVTGPSYWRGFWALPLPFLLAMVLVAPLAWRPRGRLLPGRLATVAAAALFVLFVPQVRGWSPENGVRMAWPGLKVTQPDYAVAAALQAAAGPGAAVVAPPEVSAWMTTFHHHAFPMQVRNYLHSNVGLLGEEELRRRRLMSRYAGGVRRETTRRAFYSGLGRYDVRAVCISDGLRGGARALLTEAGFERTRELAGYEIWTAAPANPPRQKPSPRTREANREALIFRDGFEGAWDQTWSGVVP